MTERLFTEWFLKKNDKKASPYIIFLFILGGIAYIIYLIWGNQMNEIINDAWALIIAGF